MRYLKDYVLARNFHALCKGLVEYDLDATLSRPLATLRGASERARQVRQNAPLSLAECACQTATIAKRLTLLRASSKVHLQTLALIVGKSAFDLTAFAPSLHIPGNSPTLPREESLP